MISIKDFLNKIKWDASLDEKDFVVYYLDNITKRLVSVPYAGIIKLEGSLSLSAAIMKKLLYLCTGSEK